MRYAIIKENKVYNIIIAEAEFLNHLSNEESAVELRESDRVEIGYSYDGESFTAPSQSMYNIVFAKITAFRRAAPNLLTELYTENTLAGLTTAQSDKMFDDYFDVLIRIREGAFPTALYRLSQKSPEGFVTQELLDKWIDKIKSYL